MRISDWSSDVCSSDLFRSNRIRRAARAARRPAAPCPRLLHRPASAWQKSAKAARESRDASCRKPKIRAPDEGGRCFGSPASRRILHVDSPARSEEHTSELQSLMRISYAVFCLKKKKKLKRLQ